MRKLAAGLFVGFSFAATVAQSAFADDRPNVDAALAQAGDISTFHFVAGRGKVASAASRLTLGASPSPWALPFHSDLSTQGPEALAFRYLEDNAAELSLDPAALARAFVKSTHDSGRGGILVVFGQRVFGVTVQDAELKVLFDRAGNVIAVSGPLPSAEPPKHGKVLKAFENGPKQSILVALSDAFSINVEATALSALPQKPGEYSLFRLSHKDFSLNSPIRTKPVFFPMGQKLVAAYYIEVDGGAPDVSDPSLWGYVIAAESGDLLQRRNLTSDVAFGYRVWADVTAPFIPMSGPQADFAPHPTGLPDNSSPAFVLPSLVMIEGLNHPQVGNLDPWLPDTAIETSGNNVDAYADIGGPDGFTQGIDSHAPLSGSFAFDYEYDTQGEPFGSMTQLYAATTQLFYSTNWLHDYFYDSGFDEKSGNAQANNFGRGGIEGDVLRAESQDAGGKNNANMSTPADGASPRMQMYLWDGVSSSSLECEPLGATPPRQPAAFGPSNFNVSADVVLMDDGTLPSVTDGCEDPVNNVAGKIVLIDRGACSFELKVLKAQQAGAVGVLIANNTPSGLAPMTEDNAVSGVTIGSFGILQGSGTLIKQALVVGPVAAALTRFSDISRDGSLDGDVVLHEWGHYLHHRLVNCGTPQCGGESEGWGDFVAMLFKVKEGDDVALGTFAVASYATIAGGDSGYFGIRRFPYSQDTSKNGLTFKHIANGVPLPLGPKQLTVPANFEVHNAGEVWTSMLFSAYSKMILSGAYPLAEARRRMADVIVLGMKLAPINPTITEQRDALLAAAFAADPADFGRIAGGFAERGAGTCATSPPRNSNNGVGVIESFILSARPEIFAFSLDDSGKTCDGDGILDGEESGKLQLNLRNSGTKNLTGATLSLTASDPGVSFPNGNMVTVPMIAPNFSDTVSVDIALDGTFSAITNLTITVTLDSPGTCQATQTLDLKSRVHLDDTQKASLVETADSEKNEWKPQGGAGFESLAAAVWQREATGPNSFWFHGQDFPARSDAALESPDIQVEQGADFTVSFLHAFDFEASAEMAGGPIVLWDGGTVEISEDAGATWADVEVYTDPGYTGTIASISGANNPLGGRPGYTGESAGWPTFSTQTLDFGTAFSGKTVRLRFRIGTDAAVGTPDYSGWFVDDITVSGAAPPFHLVTVDADGCNEPPLANAGPDLVVDEGTLFALDGSATSDVDADPLTFSWAQTAGPDIALLGADTAIVPLTAPLVDADTSLTFELTVSDGIHTAVDSVDVLVKDVPVTTGGSGGTGGGGMGGSASGGGGAGGIGGEMGGGGTGGALGGSGGGSTTSSASQSTQGEGGAGASGGSELTPESVEIAGGSCLCQTGGLGTAGAERAFIPILGVLLGLLRRRRKVRECPPPHERSKACAEDRLP